MINNIYSILFLNYEWSIASCYEFLKENQFNPIEYISDGDYHKFILKKNDMIVKTELIKLTNSVFIIIPKIE
jgi:hypothetical protein